MSQKKNRNTELMLAPTKAADILRHLAAQLETGGVEFGKVLVEPDGPVSIKQTVKIKSGKVSFKLKLKYETALSTELKGALGGLPDEELEDDEGAVQQHVDQLESDKSQPAKPIVRPKEEVKISEATTSFKSVKKNMSRGFKSIKKALAEDIVPSNEEIEAFAADCESMTTFPGNGDAHYQDFLHHVGDLKEAGRTGDAKALARAMAEIGARKKACHSERK